MGAYVTSKSRTETTENFTKRDIRLKFRTAGLLREGKFVARQFQLGAELCQRMIDRLDHVIFDVLLQRLVDFHLQLVQHRFTHLGLERFPFGARKERDERGGLACGIGGTSGTDSSNGGVAGRLGSVASSGFSVSFRLGFG